MIGRHNFGAWDGQLRHRRPDPAARGHRWHPNQPGSPDRRTQPHPLTDMSLLHEAVDRGGLTKQESLAHHDRIELKMRGLGDRVSRRTASRIANEQGWT